MQRWECTPGREPGHPPGETGGGAVCQGLCSAEISKEASVQVGLTMAGTWAAEWRGRPAQHPLHPLLQPRSLSSERAGRWCFLRHYLLQELPVQSPETTQHTVPKSWRLRYRGDQRTVGPPAQGCRPEVEPGLERLLASRAVPR